MFSIELTGSPFYRSTHFVRDAIGALVVQRSRKTATRYPTREAAEKVAFRNSWVNGFTASVVEA